MYRHFFIILLFLLFNSVAVCQAQSLLSIEGETTVCPGATETYTIETPFRININRIYLYPANAGVIQYNEGNTVQISWNLSRNSGEIKNAQIVVDYTYFQRKSIFGGYRAVNEKERLNVELEGLAFEGYNKGRVYSFIGGPQDVFTDQKAAYTFNVNNRSCRGCDLFESVAFYNWYIDDQLVGKTDEKISLRRINPRIEIDFSSKNNLSLGQHTIKVVPFNTCGEPNPAWAHEKSFTLHCPAPEAITSIDGPSFLCLGQAETYELQGASDATSYEWDFSTAPGATVSTVNEDGTFTVTLSSEGVNSLVVRPVNSANDPSCQWGEAFTLILQGETGLDKRERIVFANTADASQDIYSFGNASPPSLTVNTCEERTNGCSGSTRELTIESRLNFGENYDWGNNGGLEATVNLQLTLVSNSGDETVLEKSITINDHIPEQVWHFKLPAEQVEDLRFISATPQFLSQNLTTPQKEAVRLEVSYRNEREIEVENVTVTPVAPQSTNATWEQLFQWNSTCPEVQNYQVELLKLIKNTEVTPGPDDLRWNNALRIETESAATEQLITLGQGSGTYYWRVRAIGNKPGGLANPANEGEWSNIFQFSFIDVHQDKNWIYGRIITEENKQKEELAFANGLQQVSHQLTRINSNNEVLAVQTIQDKLGRNALVSLPFPVGDQLTYAGDKLLKKSDGLAPYSVEDFDGEFTTELPLPAQDGALYYGSESSSPSEEYVPSAEGYPYQRTIFTNDQTGRVKEQAGVGKTHSITGGKTVRTYYMGASGDELISLFGSEAPEAENVQKVITIDPNSTTSVQYIDKAGKTVATALSAHSSQGFHLEQIPLDDSIDEVSDTIKGGSLWGDYGSLSRKTVVTTLPNQSLTLDYKLAPDTLNTLCEVAEKLCNVCDYQVEIVVEYMDEEEDEVVFPGPVFNASNCSITNLSVSYPVTLEKVGRYKIEKRIRSYNRNADNQLYLDVKLDTLSSYYDAQYSSMWGSINPFLQDNDLEGLYAYLNSQNIDLEGPEGEKYYMYPVLPAADIGAECPQVYVRIPYLEDKCSEGQDCVSPDFEGYFEDYWNDRPEFLPAGPGAALPYLPGYNTGEFNQLVQNMLADTERSVSYNCDSLWNVWKALVSSYGHMMDGQNQNQQELTANLEDELLKDYFTGHQPQFDLLDSFFENAGAEKSSYYTDPANADNPGIKLFAYKNFYFDPNDSKQQTCMEQFGAGANGSGFSTLSPEDRYNVYRCVTSVASYTGGVDVTSEEMAWKLEDFCSRSCEDRRPEFRQKVVNTFYDAGYHLENDLYRVELDSFTYTYKPTVDTLTTTELSNRVSLCEIDAMVASLIANCKGNCTITVMTDAVTGEMTFGTEEEIANIQKSLFNDFDVQLQENGSCPADYTLIGSSIGSLPEQSPRMMQNANWRFGIKDEPLSGVTFANGIPDSLPDGPSTDAFLRGFSSISDSLGNFLFYSNGAKVWDKDHNLIADELKGSSYTSQSALILPQPGSNDNYYVFTPENWKRSEGLYYTLITASGQLIQKNVLVNPFVWERVTATYHRNGQDIWVIAQENNSNKFVTYLLNENGLNPNPVISHAGAPLPVPLPDDNRSNFGALKVSSDAKRLASVFGGSAGNDENFIYTPVQIFDFNNATGEISNPIALTDSLTWTLQTGKLEMADANSAEFSPDGNKLYVSMFSNTRIYQYNLQGANEEDIRASRVALKNDFAPSGGLHLGIDGKIYFTNTNLKEFWLGVIDCPNALGLNASLVPQYVQISAAAQYGLQHTLIYPEYQNFGGPHRSFCFKWADQIDSVYTIPLGFEDVVNHYSVPTCEEASMEEIRKTLTFQQEEILEQKLGELRAAYMGTCADPDNFKDTLVLRYNLGYHHFTLYYYDRAGNLMRTVPPAGVELDNDGVHSMVTNYEYNSLGQLVHQHTPDAGTTDFYYNNIGQLRFSQNAQQKLDGTYSYTKYDELGRVVEVGLATENVNALNSYVNQGGFPLAGTEKTITVYTAPKSGLTFLGESPQRYLQNRVSYTISESKLNSQEKTISYYSYDPHGNVEWLIQEIPGLGRQYLRYAYDLISGNVLKVSYNEGKADQFYHQYEYDADNRLQAVYTSADGVIWDKDASYSYYAHGPLKRMELGEDGVQGLDYVYTLQGWLKGINHPSLQLLEDPGKDASDNRFARDAFGMVLGYYEGDYSSTAGAVGFESTASNQYHLAAQDGRNLYNGNISSWTSQTQSINSGTIQYPGLTGQRFVYDELNRITNSHFKYFSSGWQDPSANAQEYASSYRYDGNGNLGGKLDNGTNPAGLTRNAYGATPQMDELIYHYYPGTNKLRLIEDQAAVGQLDFGDIKDQCNGCDEETFQNYLYDAVGNLIQDKAENISKIEWTTYGKVAKVEKEDGSWLEFNYDAAGNRIMKKESSVAGMENTTFYVRDASGNIMAVYKQNSENGYLITALTEQPIYGSDRLGQRSASIKVKEQSLSGGYNFDDVFDGNFSPGDKDWSIPLQAKEGSFFYRQDMSDLLSPGSLSDFSFSGRVSQNVQLKDWQGIPLQDVLIPAYERGKEGSAMVIDQEGRLVEGAAPAEEGSYSTREPIKAGPQSRTLSMAVPGASQDNWLFTIDEEGKAYRHRIDAGAGSRRSTIERTNEEIKAAASFAPGMALLQDTRQQKGFLYLLRQEQDSLYLEAYVQSEAEAMAPVKLDAWKGEGDGGQLKLSQDGRLLAVSTQRESSRGWFGKSAEDTNVRIYSLSSQHQEATLEQTLYLPSGRSYNSMAFGRGGNYLYLSSASLFGGYRIERMALAGGEPELVKRTGTYTELEQAYDGKLYASLTGGDHLLQIDETETGALVVEEQALNLPAGYSLAGSLPAQTVTVGGAQDEVYARVLDEKEYELKDHLGNVRALISDRKLSEIVNGEPTNFTASLLQRYDYYPFGMEMPGRRHDGAERYRYGFNGKEKDEEGLGGGGSTYDYGFRIYNPQIAKFLSVDPLTREYPWYTPYQFAGNMPINSVDLDGLEEANANEIWHYGGYGIADIRLIDESYIVVRNQEGIFFLHKISGGENDGNYLAKQYHGKMDDGTNILQSKYIVASGAVEDFSNRDYEGGIQGWRPKIKEGAVVMGGGNYGSIEDFQYGEYYKDQWTNPEILVGAFSATIFSLRPKSVVPRKVGNLAGGPLENATKTSGRFKLKGGPADGTLYRSDNQGNITNYATYDSDGMIIKRVDVTGPAHRGVETPHVIEYGRNTSPDGTVHVQSPDTKLPPRSATTAEIP